jgi:methylenetetrahydrofolate dehydrogenase (NADP+)/methenyltetrahydrofolate cyclohydrolase
MGGLVLDGRPPARQIEAQVAARVAALRQAVAGGRPAAGRPPALAILLVGADRTAARHGQLKERACRRVGMEALVLALPEQATTAEVLARIDRLNDDPRVDGIFLQHPLPRHVDERRCFDRIAAGKDVGGDSSLSFGRLAAAAGGGGGEAGASGGTGAAAGEGFFAAATPAAIMRLLAWYGVSVEGRRAVVVGRSPMVGKPLSLLLLGANATVTICHSRTRDLAEIVRRGEVVVGAAGKPELIKGDWIRDGAVVIDAGYHPFPAGSGGGTGGTGSMGGAGAAAAGTGDVELQAVAGRCAAYTPVPGGVGPMTVAMLLANTVAAAEMSAGAAGAAGATAAGAAGAGATAASALRTGPPPGRPG